MAAEGKNKAASSLLDLQPSAVLELFRVYPDRVNKPNMFVGFHGGSIFDNSITWQGIQYLPLAIESEGFDILGDGKLARPKIRVANKNNIITNLLQNYKDFKNAKVIRKKVQVKFLDDNNFDGGNPFGVADSKAELLDEEWIMGRKTQESKIFVEFELNSPLDLENFSINSRGIQAKFCYWQYRGEGCRYQGLPIEQEDGSPFLDTGNTPVVPTYEAPLDPDGIPAQTDFFGDESIKWNPNKEYKKSGIVIVESPAILIPSFGGDDVNAEGVPLKTVYVSVADNNSGNTPEKNPSFWQKDGCTKRLGACQRRFNTADNVNYPAGGDGEQSFLTVKLTGASLSTVATKHSGLFHTTEADVTGALDPRKEWTVVGWANVNNLSPKGAGLFSTSQGGTTAGAAFPANRFVNIQMNTSNNVEAVHWGYAINHTSLQASNSAYRAQFLNKVQTANAGDNEEWHQYIIRHRTGTANFINGEGDNETTLIEFFVDGTQSRYAGAHRAAESDRLRNNMGNFASYAERTADFDNGVGTYDWPDDVPMLPQTFMIGGVEYFSSNNGYPDGASHVSSINGYLGMWGLWNRALKEEEIRFLRKRINSPWQSTSNAFTHVPRLYSECLGRMSTLTGGTGWNDPLAGGEVPVGTAPLLYGEDSLVAWWDGSTGFIGDPADDVTGMLDIHTEGNHLTGSGQFSGVDKTYESSTIVAVANPTPPNPRFGGFPGTDGFSYGGAR